MCDRQQTRYSNMIERAMEWSRRADPAEAIAINALVNAIVDLEGQLDQFRTEQWQRDLAGIRGE